MQVSNNIKTNLKKNQGIVFLIGIIALVYLSTWYIGHPIGCIFERFLGISCPGCGLFTAWYFALQGQIQLALYFNPLFWLIPILFLILFIDKFILAKPSPKTNYILIPIVLTFIIVYLLRITGIITIFAPLVAPWL